jgi:hypothetical protein
MMEEQDFYLIEPIIEKMVEKISDDESITNMEAMKKFYNSETYRMLTDSSLFIWNISDKGIYDLWLTECETGDPRNSDYL